MDSGVLLTQFQEGVAGVILWILSIFLFIKMVSNIINFFGKERVDTLYYIPKINIGLFTMLYSTRKLILADLCSKLDSFPLLFGYFPGVLVYKKAYVLLSKLSYISFCVTSLYMVHIFSFLLCNIYTIENKSRVFWTAAKMTSYFICMVLIGGSISVLYSSN